MKSEVVSWALILGGVAAVSYIGYRAIGNLFSGGSLDPTSLLGIGSGAGDRDIFGNTTTAKVSRDLASTKAAISEQNISLIQGREMIEKYDYGPELKRAYASYDKELSEYNALLAAFEPSYGFWTGKEDPETTEYRRVMGIEYQEAVAAHRAFTSINEKWMAANA